MTLLLEPGRETSKLEYSFNSKKETTLVDLHAAAELQLYVTIQSLA